MSEPDPDPRNLIAPPIQRRRSLGPAVGYFTFVTGTLLSAWLARRPQPNGNNPALVLLVVWVIVGLTHILVTKYWRACAISAFGSGVGYAALVVAFFPHEAGNEMFGAGIIEVGLFGFFLSMLMGIPVALYRMQRRESLEAEQ